MEGPFPSGLFTTGNPEFRRNKKTSFQLLKRERTCRKESLKAQPCLSPPSSPAQGSDLRALSCRYPKLWEDPSGSSRSNYKVEFGESSVGKAQTPLGFIPISCLFFSVPFPGRPCLGDKKRSSKRGSTPRYSQE